MWGRLHPEETLIAALHMLPGTKHVVVVGCVGKLEERFETTAKEAFHNYGVKLEFTYFANLTMSDLLERLKHLPSHTIVYYTAITQDAAGARFIDTAQSVPLVAWAALAPAFVMDDLDLRGATVGGDLVNWADDGRVAAEMAARVLNGEEPENMLIVTSNHNYAFDQDMGTPIRTARRQNQRYRVRRMCDIACQKIPSSWAAASRNRRCRDARNWLGTRSKECWIHKWSRRNRW